MDALLEAAKEVVMNVECVQSLQQPAEGLEADWEILRQNTARLSEVIKSHIYIQEHILHRLQKAFEWMEQRQLRVGHVWLNPKEVAELSKHPSAFDYEVVGELVQLAIDQLGAPLKGYLWGAQVIESALVHEDHVLLVPEGVEAKLVDPAACMPL